MLFVPDEDYIRVPINHAGTASVNTSAADPATATADDDINDGAAAAGGDDGDKEDDAGPVSPSLLFASQAQYLGHSNQVTLNVVNSSELPVHGLFVPWTVRTLLDCSYRGLFVPSWTVRTMDYSYRPGLFVPSWTVRTMDCSYRPWTIRTMLRKAT